MAGQVGGGPVATYGASEAFQSRFAELVHDELAEFGIDRANAGAGHLRDVPHARTRNPPVRDRPREQARVLDDGADPAPDLHQVLERNDAGRVQAGLREGARAVGELAERGLASSDATVMIEGAGHYAHAELPDLVGPTILKFLQACAW